MTSYQRLRLISVYLLLNMAISVSRYLQCKVIFFFKIGAVLFKMSEFRRVAGRYILFCYLKIIPGCRARFSRLGKCPSETEQGFPAWENVPLEPSKVFPPGKMFLGNRARFSRPGKCSSETEQGFPAWGNVPRKPSKVFPVNFIMNSSFVGQIRSCGGRMRYAPTYLPFVRWGYGDGSFRFVLVFRRQL